MSVIEKVREAPAVPVTADPVVELLKAAQEEVRAGWCRCHAAIDEDRREVSVISNRAVAVCASGALERAAWRLNDRRHLLTAAGLLDDVAVMEAYERDLEGIVKATILDVVDYNDRAGCTQAEIVALYDRAIAARGASV